MVLFEDVSAILDAAEILEFQTELVNRGREGYGYRFI
jgi:hypothetical protein